MSTLHSLIENDDAESTNSEYNDGEKFIVTYDAENKIYHYRFRVKKLVTTPPEYIPERSPAQPEGSDVSYHAVHKTEPVPQPLRMSINFSYPDSRVQAELARIAQKIVAPGKGIISTEESASTMGQIFVRVSVDNSKENRRRYRELLFTSDPTIGEYISGVILFHDTLYQKTANGELFIDILRDHGILIGIKVDKGTVPLYCSENEVTTQGLDDLDTRCAQYKKDGCDFAKWRCVLKINKNITPSYQAIMENAHILARYASICQAHSIVPILQPEVLSDGDHDIERAQKVTETVIAAIYKALNDHHVYLEGTLLNPNMVIPGMQCTKRASNTEIAVASILALSRTVPPAVAGIILLSGSQQEEEASINLDAINKSKGRKPWPLTFCCGPAQQASVLSTWGGKPENVAAAQHELLKRAKILSLASRGWYYRIDPLGSPAQESVKVTRHSPN